MTCSLMGKIISRFYKNRIPFRGLVFDPSIPEIASTNKAQLFWGIYESAEIRFIQKYLPKSVDVIELGSSIGVISSFIRRRLKKDVRLVCVEGHPILNKQTGVNLKINQLYHNVECISMAIDYTSNNDNSVFFTPGQLSTTGKVTCRNSQTDSILVKAITLSALKSTFHINNFVLVVDIEGEEVNIIRKDKEALNDCQHLFIELHNTTYNGISVSVEDMLEENRVNSTVR
jgi:FkbM family methyltransferase